MKPAGQKCSHIKLKERLKGTMPKSPAGHAVSEYHHCEMCKEDLRVDYVHLTTEIDGQRQPTKWHVYVRDKS